MFALAPRAAVATKAIGSSSLSRSLRKGGAGWSARWNLNCRPGNSRMRELIVRLQQDGFTNKGVEMLKTLPASRNRASGYDPFPLLLRRTAVPRCCLQQCARFSGNSIGHQLAPKMRNEAEVRCGNDLSAARLHTGPAAERSTASVGADHARCMNSHGARR
jgi:hypothetical protein